MTQTKWKHNIPKLMECSKNSPKKDTYCDKHLHQGKKRSQTNTTPQGTKGMYFNIIKAIKDKSTANIIPNSEMLKAFLLRSGITHGCPLLNFIHNEPRIHTV